MKIFLTLILLCIGFAKINAQTTQLVGLKSWASINGFLGKSINTAKKLLNKNGFHVLDKEEDKNLGLTTETFYPKEISLANKGDKGEFGLGYAQQKIELAALYNRYKNAAACSKDIERLKKIFAKDGYLLDLTKKDEMLLCYQNKYKKLAVLLFLEDYNYYGLFIGKTEHIEKLYTELSNE
ncbi:MAG: hypothetical protein ACOYKE_01370 [Ferruginibacter sp.]